MKKKTLEELLHIYWGDTPDNVGKALRQYALDNWVPEEAQAYSDEFPGSPYNETGMFNDCRQEMIERIKGC